MDTRNSILIVDDDEKLLDIFKTALSLEGYRCETAGSAKYALELINKIPFDILITDIKMPGATGFELTEKAKKIKPDMAVIIMTAYIEEFAYNSAIEVGASDFIKKPFTMKELIARIQHVKRQEEIRALSFTDDLTGLYNRRGFFTLVEQQLKLFKRQMKGIYMLYADVDNLKEINDILGHKEGDMALIDVANILRKNYREADIIARIGGDEFVVIPVETTGDNIDIISSRLQKSLKLHNAEKNHKYKLSISVGIAYYNPENPCSVDDLLVRADKAMYEQKMLKKKS
jgi:diguanylate cyclase (GGDEF)-like protein